MEFFVPFFAVMYIVDSYKVADGILRRICYFSLFVAAMGIIEFYLQRRFYFDLLPQWYLNALMESNPAVADMVNAPMFRNGWYRAASIFGIALPFGEFEAMVAPLGFRYLCYGTSARDRFLGAAVSVSSIVAIFTSGARGAYIAWLTGLSVFVVIAILRDARRNPNSMVTALGLTVFAACSIIVGGLIVFWPRLHNVILGGGQEQFSTNARWDQWALLKPRLFENVIAPIFGHGIGNSGTVIPYFTPGGKMPSVDSYILTLLADVGIPGALLFFGTIVIVVCLGVRRFTLETTKDSILIGAVSIAILAYGVYRITLSLEENNFLFYVLLGIFFGMSFAETSGTGPPLKGSVARASLRGKL